MTIRNPENTEKVMQTIAQLGATLALQQCGQISNDYDIVEAEDFARTMINDRGVIRYKLEHGLGLTSEEKEFILGKI